MLFSDSPLLPERFLNALCDLRSTIFDGSPAEDLGLTPALAKALIAIASTATGNMRVRELAEALGIKESSASVLSNRLVLSGLIMKKAHEDDGRVAMLAITQEGARLATSLKAHRLARATELLCLLPENEQRETVLRLETMSTKENKQ
ncbi:MAG: MarR family winged helix-turn-helix transcriptional regulator [Clostridia bacterium]|jgi:DNA-binding MarR family transcriptional regulator